MACTPSRPEIVHNALHVVIPFAGASAVRHTIHRFVGYALTPVHIGDGTTMTPDGYRLQSSSPAILERFDPPAVIAAMSPALRAEYIRALSRGHVHGPGGCCRKAADDAIRERLSISPVLSRYEIEQVMTEPAPAEGVSVLSFAPEGRRSCRAHP